MTFTSLDHPSITLEQQDELKSLFSRGIQKGDDGSPNKTMCVQQAVSMVTDGVFTDSPSCVAKPDCKFLIRLNDSNWSSNEARAKGLWKLALLQLGTAGTRRADWMRALVFGMFTRVLPLMLEALEMPEEAEECRGTKTLEEAKGLARSIWSTTSDLQDMCPTRRDILPIDHAQAAVGFAVSAIKTALAPGHRHHYLIAEDVGDVVYYASFILSDKILLEAVDVALDAYAGVK